MPTQTLKNPYRKKLIALLTFLVVWPTFVYAETPMKLGLYVVVDDMQIAKTFYNALFATQPTVDYGNFVSYRMQGSLFALFAKESYGPVLQRGNSVVPYIQVEDIEMEFKRVSTLSATMLHKQVVDEGAIKLFMFTDPSGNALEFFSLTQ